MTVTNDMTRKFEKNHYTALKCLYNKDEAGIDLSLTNARKTIVESLKSESLECTNTLYKYLRMLQQIQQIEDFCDVGATI
jgi:serine-protein kinase ATM